MRVILADSFGMCFGVRDAIEMALRYPVPSDLTVLGELVHNPEVLRRLDRAGIRRAPGPDAPVRTGTVMITAHGAADSVAAGLGARGLRVVDATCPLVTHAHRSLRRLVEDGCFPVVIGKADHVEVRGLVGDLEEYAVVERPEDVSRIPLRPRLGVVSQTTQPPDHVGAMVAAIRAAFPGSEVRAVNTVCRPTRDRQEAARRLARECDVVVVVGGRNSNNTRQLVRACEREGAVAYQVESAAELLPEWFEGAAAVGLTAGTSTPDEVIHEVHRTLLRLDGARRLTPPEALLAVV